jgi:hypothetical protein
MTTTFSSGQRNQAQKNRSADPTPSGESQEVSSVIGAAMIAALKNNLNSLMVVGSKWVASPVFRPGGASPSRNQLVGKKNAETPSVAGHGDRNVIIRDS